jgi:hypothetical protein
MHIQNTVTNTRDVMQMRTRVYSRTNAQNMRAYSCL